MDKNRKREIAREYREREVPRGVYAVRCKPTGEVWVSGSRRLDTQQTALWFQLRTGGMPNKALQVAWNDHGEDAFGFEILETVTDDNPQLIDSLVKDREQHWRTELGARKVVG
ncbi:MAG: GIY-YIG nuclease family protein [Alphaproteobacteria bacterium]|nr:GIY-YIG nuclease family protein [Alphaproteobacteria bacterium]